MPQRKDKKESEDTKKEKETENTVEATPKKKFIALLIVVILIVCSGYYAFLYLQKDNGDDNPPDEPEDVPPVADAGNDNEAYTLVPLKFDGSNSYDPDGEIQSWSWSFGDGSYSTEIRPAHAYNISGTFVVILTVKDNDGNVARDSLYVKVLNRAPAVYADAPADVTVYTSANFNGSASDLDGYIVLYQWDFDGDGTFDWSAKTTGKTHYFFKFTGDYTARFKVTDDDGDTNATEVPISVEPIPNNAPSANAGSDQRVGVGKVMLFGTGTDPDDNIALYEWDFDGNDIYDWYSTENGFTNHTYLSESIYPAVFRVTDEYGLQDEDQINITVDNSFIIERISASVMVSWNQTDTENNDFPFKIKFNNSFDPLKLTVIITTLPSGNMDKLSYPSDISQIDDFTAIISNPGVPTEGQTLAVEVFYLENLIGQREIVVISTPQRQYLIPSLNRTAEYSYMINSLIVQEDTTRKENHTGVLKVTAGNQLVESNYKGSGKLKVTQELEDANAEFDLTSSSIYRNVTFESGQQIQESFEFGGTGHYKLTSTQGSSFDITLDKYRLKEQDGIRTDFYFSGKGPYSNPPIDGNIEISYRLEGLDIHSNWEGIKYTCEKYRINTTIIYEIEQTKYKVRNESYIWVVAEKEQYKDTTIYVEYKFSYSVNNYPVENESGSYYPLNSPVQFNPVDNILNAIDFNGITPLAYRTGDSVTISSPTDLVMQYIGQSEGQRSIEGESYTTTEILGNVVENGAGTSTITIVNFGKYSGWILSKHEQYQWNDDRFEIKLELID